MATVHIVVARANVNHNGSQFTRNMFVKTGVTKRMRGGTQIASVTIEPSFTHTPGGLASPNHVNVCGLALYDVGKTLGKIESILIKGVADVILTSTNLAQVKNSNCVKILRKIGEDEYRCFFDFTKDQHKTAAISKDFNFQSGLESTETHLAVTHEFDQITKIEDYNVGFTTNFAVKGIKTSGIMLWPLTDKALSSTKGQYHRAAVLTRGVATCFVDEISGYEPLKPCNIKCKNDGSNTLKCLVLEVYEKSIKIAF